MRKTKQKELVWTFLALAWPTILEQLLGTIVQYIDTAMVGRLGAEATATVSLSSTYTWMINGIMSSFGIGFLSFIARAIGEKDEDKVKKTAGQAVLTAVVIGAVLTVITLFFAPFMPKCMGAEESIRKDASIYFAVINIPLIFRSCMTIFAAILRGCRDTKTPMKIHILVNVVNTCLNYVCIYMLSLGAVGAGIATAISYVLGGILMTIAFLKNDRICIRRENIKPDRQVLSKCFAIGVPVMFTQIVSCSGYVVATSFVSSMPTGIYAAHSIAITAETIFYIPGYGMQAATSTMIGNAIGENDRKKEHSIMKLAILIIFGFMCVSGMLLYVGAEFMMSLFSKNPEVIRIGADLLRIVAFTEPVFGSAAVMEGIYAGLGKTKAPLMIELISRWGIRILGSFLCIRVWHLGIQEIWYCMIADNMTKAVLLAALLLWIIRNEKKGI